MEGVVEGVVGTVDGDDDQEQADTRRRGRPGRNTPVGEVNSQGFL